MPGIPYDILLQQLQYAIKLYALSKTDSSHVQNDTANMILTKHNLNVA